jgi:selenium metabolism protein YedF
MEQKVIFIQGEGLGRGDEKLGSLLMANFFRLLADSQAKPKSIVFWNTGVRLLCEGSPVLDYLKTLEEQGVDLVACTTCLEYFGLREHLAAGKPTTMMKSISAVMSDEVITL